MSLIRLQLSASSHSHHRHNQAYWFLFILLHSSLRMYTISSEVPVFGMRDGVNDGVVDSWSLGNHSRNRVHVRGEQISVATWREIDQMNVVQIHNTREVKKWVKPQMFTCSDVHMCILLTLYLPFDFNPF